MIGQLLTIKEACAALKVSRGTMSAMIRDGRVRAKNLNPGGLRPRWRVFADSLEEVLKEALTIRATRADGRARGAWLPDPH